MSNIPDFTAYGYQVLQQLGKNGDRYTWKAKTLNDEIVVIKEFRFGGATMESLKEYERELQSLKSLKHPYIPNYLSDFETEQSFCLVQAYINAPNLAITRPFKPEEIKIIAVKILKILVYLQEEIVPFVTHRDIKPENILVDDNLNVYLIDFGLSRVGNNTLAMSSVAGGTFGFMPPEQIHNQKLTKASDLYSFGATLICLVTGIKSVKLGELVDLGTGRIVFKDRLPELSLRFIQWLEKMVEPDPNKRFPNAKTALETLKPLYVIRVPEPKLSHNILNFEATKLGEKLSTKIKITNTIHETKLEGNFAIVAHSNDHPHTPDSHSWISFSPKNFSGNINECKIIIDTSKLMSDKVYQREIILQTNGNPENSIIPIKVKTAPLIVNVKKIPFVLLSLLLILSFLETGSLLYYLVIVSKFNLIQILQGSVSYILTVIFSIFFSGCLFTVAFILDSIFIKNKQAMKWAIKKAVIKGKNWGIVAGIIISIAVAMSALRDMKELRAINIDIFLILFGLGLLGLILWFTYQHYSRNKFSKLFSITSILLILILGIILGIGTIAGFSNPLILLSLTVTSVPLAAMLFYFPLKKRKIITEYRKKEQKQQLIKP